MGKVLVIISGQPRFTRESIRNIRANLIEPIEKSGRVPVVIMSLWSQTNFEKFSSTVGAECEKWLLDEMQSVLKPAILHIEPSIDFFATQNENKIKISLKEAPSYESQYYILQKAVDLCDSHLSKRNTQPELAIRTRADLLFMKPFGTDLFARAMHRFMIPLHQGHGWRGDRPPSPWKLKSNWFPDQFWMGPWPQIRHMCSFYSLWSPDLLVYGESIENMMKAHAQKKKIVPMQFPLLNKIERTINNK